jgi:hypothetical protein
MKLAPEQVLYVVAGIGGPLRVTGIFTDQAATNEHLSSHSDEGLAAEFAPYLFTAKLADKGTRIG